ncbi:MAG TPA: GLPGLI family protein [Chitinophagaceae bacterium]|nr:GLPGLI family protein [Chitinophagaceae bacterium]MCC6635443.1 GLPGLI family protein [Chitinophagaceae bacterium]HMZ45752.1 GLPGLI family protein [Chitinophagaceae bacterium]HNE93041.1 GLPGLI family protein [Chitinophagaceae bacterium]HNF29510.1 GLPGLI family protein [Chitinophagaceae bacterium]
MKSILLSFIFYFLFINLPAQQIFINTGKIEFEKQVNLHKVLELSWGDEENDNVWIMNMKKELPKIKSTFYNLYFTQNKTIYKAGKEAPQTAQKIPEWLADNDALENITYTDLATHKTIAKKKVFETTFLLEDSITKINWRITNDTRTIAGIECRKAVGKIFDSVYVIAFYTDLITCTGGPLSFTGLPGMILGVAIPRIHTTLFATKVELANIDETIFAIPKSGKKTSYVNLLKQLKSSMNDWGKEGNLIIWKTLL